MRFSRSVSKEDGGKVARCWHSHVKWLYSAVKSIFCIVVVDVHVLVYAPSLSWAVNCEFGLTNESAEWNVVLEGLK